MGKSIDRYGILAGAIYALVNGRRLLMDACTLLEGGANGNGMVLAIFAREEFGRFALLLRRALEMLDGDREDVKAIQQLCEEHVRKLRAGLTIPFAPIPKSLAKKLREAPADRADPRREALMAEVDGLFRRWLKRQPHDAHTLRMRSLYVDLSDDGTWLRPTNDTPEEAQQLLSAISADYGNHLIQLWNSDIAQQVHSRIPETPLTFDMFSVLERVHQAIAFSQQHPK